MAVLGATSRKRRDTCHVDLQILVDTLIEDGFDIRVLCGWRGETAQNEAFRTGNSTKRWGESKHNNLTELGDPCSLAVDLAIWHPDPPQIRWNDWHEWYFMCGYVLGRARGLFEEGLMDHELRSGLDWDKDFDIHDQKFNDGPHFELMVP